MNHAHRSLQISIWFLSSLNSQNTFKHLDIGDTKEGMMLNKSAIMTIQHSDVLQMCNNTFISLQHCQNSQRSPTVHSSLTSSISGLQVIFLAAGLILCYASDPSVCSVAHYLLSLLFHLLETINKLLCLEPGGFLGHWTFSTKTGTVQANQASWSPYMLYSSSHQHIYLIAALIHFTN